MLKLVKYEDKYYGQWNNFIESSNNGTIFHRLDFLDYHKDRFKDNTHNLLWLKGDTIFAVMPFAIFNENNKLVGKSPYGASFGGLVYGKKFHLKYAIEIVDSLHKYINDLGINEISITLTPDYYSTFSNNYFEYALSRKGFNLYIRDIFNVLPLSQEYVEVWSRFEGRSRTAIKKAKNNFKLLLNTTIEEFYPILLEDKTRHNNSQPTHSFSQLLCLKNIFPDRIIFDVAVSTINNSKAGICYFSCNQNTIMTFYLSQEDKAVGENGINVLLEHGIKRACENNFKLLDFGGSSIGYNIQNIGVAEFKEGFGSKGRLRDSYLMKL